MGRTTTQSFLVTTHQRQFVDSLVASGRYKSATEVVRESLCLLEKREEARAAYWADVRAKVAVGEAEMDRGEFIDGETFVKALEEGLVRKARASSRRKR